MVSRTQVSRTQVSRTQVSRTHAVWPSYVRVEADGHGLQAQPDVARTPFDDGLVRQEKRFSSALTVRRITGWLASDGDLVRFREWAREHAHTWFAWTDPEDGITREVRVRGGAGAIACTARVRSGTRTWTVTAELEGLSGRTIDTGASSA